MSNLAFYNTMKRTIVTEDDVASFYSLFNAWLIASRGNGKDKRKDIIQYSRNVEENIRNLSRKIKNGEWTPDKGRTLVIFTEGKHRKIHTVNVEARIVFQALVTAFKLEKFFVNRTFGSIKNRGTLKANKQVRRDLYRHPGLDYCLKTDYKHYYESIVKYKLMEMINHKFKGSFAINLFKMCIDAYNPCLENGISIGSVMSQNNGNFYLTPLDMFIMGELKIKCFSRNVDDTVILCTKERGAQIIAELENFSAQFGLIYSKIALFPISTRRIDFCGYAVNRDEVRVRASTVRKYFKRLYRLTKHKERIGKTRSVVSSYEGILKHGDTNHLSINIKQQYNEIFNRINRHTAFERSKKRKTLAS